MEGILYLDSLLALCLGDPSLGLLCRRHGFSLGPICSLLGLCDREVNGSPELGFVRFLDRGQEVTPRLAEASQLIEERIFASAAKARGAYAGLEGLFLLLGLGLEFAHPSFALRTMVLDLVGPVWRFVALDISRRLACFSVAWRRPGRLLNSFASEAQLVQPAPGFNILLLAVALHVERFRRYVGFGTYRS